MWLIPSAAEREHLGRFYAATLLLEITHLAMPFQVLLIVVYLGDARLGIVFFVEHLVSLAMEVPTGAWADRFGRKKSVLAGHLVSALGWLCIPAATLLSKEHQLAGMCAAFSVLGGGMALVSGAFESWVVDNLRAVGRRDLTLRFFGRERSIASTGGIVADVTVLIVLSAATALVDVRLFFIVTGLGELLALVVLWREPEHEPLDDESPTDHLRLSASNTELANDDGADDLDEPDVTIQQAIREGFTVIARRPALLALAAVLLWTAATFGMVSEAFQAAFISVHHDARAEQQGLAAMELGNDVIGAVAALAAVWLVRCCTARGVMAAAIIVPAGFSLLMFLDLRPLGVASLYLLAVAGTHIFHVTADDYQHQLLSSSTRATASSALNLLTSLAGLPAAAWMGWLLNTMSATQAVAVMGLATLPAVLFLIPRKPQTAQAAP